MFFRFSFGISFSFSASTSSPGNRPTDPHVASRLFLVLPTNTAFAASITPWWGLVLLGEGRKDRDTGTKVVNIGVVGWCFVIPLLPSANSLHGWSHVGATEKKKRARRGKISTCYVRDAQGVPLRPSPVHSMRACVRLWRQPFRSPLRVVGARWEMDVVTRYTEKPEAGLLFSFP